MNKEDQILDILALMQTEMRSMRGDISSMRGEMNARFESVDQRFESIDQRFESVDQRFEGVENELAKINIKLENQIEPQINALMEGQKLMLETLAPRAKVDELEDRVKFLEFRRSSNE